MENDELSLEELEHVEAGTGLKYDEAKERQEKALGKFRPMPEKSADLEKNNADEELSELSEEDLEKYMGGIRIEGDEYFPKR